MDCEGDTNVKGENPEYSESNIKKTVWGDITHLADGRWSTVWQLEFSVPHSERTIDVISDSAVGFDAVLKINGRRGTLNIVTREHAMSGVNYPMTYKCFRIVNDDIGEIWKIQGRPRDWYAPFR